MKVGCPFCGGKISASNVDLDTGTAVCSACDETIVLSDQYPAYPVKHHYKLTHKRPRDAYTCQELSPNELRLWANTKVNLFSPIVAITTLILFWWASAASGLVSPSQILRMFWGSGGSQLIDGVIWMTPWLLVPLPFLVYAHQSWTKHTLVVTNSEFHFSLEHWSRNESWRLARKDLVGGFRIKINSYGNLCVEIVFTNRTILWPVRNSEEGGWLIHILQKHLSRTRTVEQPKVEKIACPECHNTITKSDYCHWRHWAKCRNCNEIFDDSTSKHGTDSLVTHHPHIGLKQVRHLTITTTPTELRLLLNPILLTNKVSSFRGIYAGVYFAVAGAWLWMAFSAHENHPVVMIGRISMTAILFLFSMGPIGLALWFVLSSYEIRINQNQAIFVRRSGWIRNDVVLPRHSIKLAVVASQSSGTEWKDAVSKIVPGVQFILKGGRFTLPVESLDESIQVISAVNDFLMCTQSAALMKQPSGDRPC